MLWSLALGYLPSLILAVIVNEMVHFKSAFRVTIYLPAVIPGIAAMLMWCYIYYPDQTGLLNMLLIKTGMNSYGWLNNPRFTISGIVIYSTWKVFGSTMLLYYAAVQGASVELYEAALIDGAGPWKCAWDMTRPHLEGILL